MKRLITIALAAAFLGGLLGSTAVAQQMKVGLVTINLQALFFNQINDGATKAAAENNIDLTIVDGNNDPSRQVQAIEDFITQQMDAIVVVAIDVEGIKPAVQDARDAGIPVVAIDAKVAVPPANGFIGVDNFGAGVEAGAYALGYVQGMMGGTAKVGIVGALNSFIQNQRKDGFVQVLDANPGIEIVGTVDGQNVQEVALTAAENLVTANPDMNIIYATGEPALIGVIAAVQSQGVQDRVTVIGWDLTKQAIQALDSGYVAAVVQQNPYEEGYQAVLAGMKLANGESVPEETLIPITIVTKANVDQYRSLFQ